jgi:FAD/FMN-containing dehydrogenase
VSACPTNFNSKFFQVAYINFYSPDPNSSSEFISLLIQNATQWAKEGWGGYLLPGTVGKQISGFLMMTPLLNNSQAVASMKAVFDFANTSGNYIYNSGVDEYDSFYDMYETFLAPSGEKIGLGTALGGRLIPASQFEGADNQAALLTALTTIQDMITWPTRSPDQSLLTYGAPFQILVTTPNNYPTTAENDTSALHPAWRDAVWSMVINVPFSNSASADDIRTAFQVTTSATDVLRKLNPVGGAYLNEADTFEPDPVNTYWGSANYERLLKIKKEIDPGNILTCWDAIGWDPTDERYSCYPSL